MSVNSSKGATMANLETIEIVSVKDGKFHRPDNVVFNGGSGDLRNARLMRCGRSLVPFNFFETIASANGYTGGQLERFICQQCEHKVTHLWRVPEVLKNGNPTSALDGNDATKGTTR
jgi:hypothetical protein